jgi:ribosomal protein L11 methylase PrmA
MILMHKAFQTTGSFRDPAGYVFTREGRVFRTINEVARLDYESIRDRQIFSKAIQKKYLVDYVELDKADWPVDSKDVAYVVEHPRIPYISYPYEWSFSQLKAAALHQLDFHLELLEHDAVLSDATAYNIQFIGHKPIFIDLLSLKPYRQGAFWSSHRQFCEQFLNPLLLRSLMGVCHNAWFRGALEGISTSDLARLIPLSKKFSWNVISQVILQAKLEGKAIAAPDHAIKQAKSRPQLSKAAYHGLLFQMRQWISKLEPAHTGKTIWQDYACTNTYTSKEASLKRQFIKDFIKATKPNTVVDIGCNTGDYSLAALEAGAKYVVGFDIDQRALDLAFSRATNQNLSFLPLYLDAANASPVQGWMQLEREGFAERTKADALIALAFEHHLAIAKNIPLKQVIQWLVDIAPQGVIEFVPKLDSTIQKMLALREDIFSDYSIEAFEMYLNQTSKIVQKHFISEDGRCLFWYQRNANL